MATQITIKFDPAAFAECLQGLSGQVQDEAEKIAARASSSITKGSGFHVEMSNEPRFQDSAHDGATRPIARVVSNDEETAREEAEYKILSKAVTG